jgi:hypothetical protein
VFVIEQNRDGQLRSLLLLETNATKDRLKSICVYGGIPLAAEDVVRGVLGEAAALGGAGPAMRPAAPDLQGYPAHTVTAPASPGVAASHLAGSSATEPHSP